MDRRRREAETSKCMGRHS